VPGPGYNAAVSSRPLPAWLFGAVLTGMSLSAAAQDAPNALLEFQYSPAPRAQIAIWIEDASGNYIKTVRLTDATAYRGVGNRPGASQMNSGYRWPYGRREGTLPRWAHQRAAGEGAEQFKRVIFQDRVEGLASRTVNDQSVDDYYCLSFDAAKSARDALDAVSCASVFSSDKGRYLTESDSGYAEPYEGLLPPHAGGTAELPLISKYPPRMDVTGCDNVGCYDHDDVSDFAAHARDVMPDIDVITMATPEGNTPQSELFSVPELWPRGEYVAWIEINVEGDYNENFDDVAYPTPLTPNDQWDHWAINFGYPYRGQPSVVYRIPFELGEVGVQDLAADMPVGRTSWDHWDSSYGELESMDGMTNDPGGAPGSGADRMLRGGGGGERVGLIVETWGELPDPEDVPDPAVMEPDPPGDDRPTPVEVPDVVEVVEDETSESGATFLVSEDMEIDGAVGPIRGLELLHHSDDEHAHDWIIIRFDAANSDRTLHEYQVRIGTEPIVDEESFLRVGREARIATESAEGATALVLPVDAPPGETVEGEIGDLRGETKYWIGVRAVDRRLAAGVISVASITTQERVFTTVSRCFVATAAYGTPLAAEVGVLRRFRDRLLMTHGPGRALVAAYYSHGADWAAYLREHDGLRSVVRGGVDALVGLVEWLDD